MRRLPSGALKVDYVPAEQHRIGEKVIPSNFFGQPDTEHISAVLFTNSGTSAKFSRMGYQHGYSNNHVDITRTGFFWNTDPETMDPTFFSYNLVEPPLVETWGQGLVISHNPDAMHPLPRDFFVGAVQEGVEDGKLVASAMGFHPLSSMTYVVHFGEERPPRAPRFLVEAIREKEFRRLTGLPRNPIVTEDGWFADESFGFLGVVSKDNFDQDWGFAILARDECWLFRAIDFDTSLPTRDHARRQIYERMAKLQSKGQRIFPDGS